jgi:hypothetical protein
MLSPYAHNVDEESTLEVLSPIGTEQDLEVTRWKGEEGDWRQFHASWMGEELVVVQ